jgi:hypothetical protein
MSLATKSLKSQICGRIEVTAGDVATWNVLEVQNWCIDCGLTEDNVLINIQKYKINGNHMVQTGITASSLGASDLMSKQFDLNIQQLKLRDIREKLREKRKLIAENVVDTDKVFEHTKSQVSGKYEEEIKGHGNEDYGKGFNDDEMGFTF